MSPPSKTAPILYPGPPPAQADIVVIGGGIIGVMAAYYLAEGGLRVVLLEKGRVAGEQSSRNWGWIRQQGRDLAELPIMMEASRLWEGLAAEAGPEIGFRRAGVVYLARSAARLAAFERWAGAARGFGLDCRLLGAAAATAMFPGAAGGWHGALHTPSDARAEPLAAVQALARLAAQRGVVIVEDCAARGLDLAAGRVAGVVTEAGRIGCREALVAGGSWSALLLRRHGLSIPQLSVRASVAATAPLPEVFAGNASDGRTAFRRRGDGGYTLARSGFQEFFIGPDAFRHLFKYLPQIRQDPFGTRYYPAAPRFYPDAWGTARRWALDAPSPFERCRMLSPKPHAGALAEAARGFAAMFPGLGEVRLAASWAGMIDTLPDNLPILDRAPISGLTIATGMAGHGFGIAPAFGRVLADLVMGQAPGHDLGPFRFARFSDGSKIDLGSAL